MNGLPYYKAYPRDFIEGTIGMEFEIKCAYRVVLDLIYMQGGNLPDDARYISGLLGCSVRKWNNIRSTLLSADKIQIIGEFLTNYRAVIELESLSKVQDKQRENRSRPNKIKELDKPRSNHTEPEPESEKNHSKNDDFSGSKSDEKQPSQPTKSQAGFSQTGEPADAFDEFWDAHPKPRSKPESQQAFLSAVAAGTDAAVILFGAKAYATQQAGTEAQYVKGSLGWLTDERWREHRAAAQAKPASLEDTAQMWAGKILRGDFIPDTAISGRMRNEIIQRGFATANDLAERGIA